MCRFQEKDRIMNRKAWIHVQGCHPNPLGIIAVILLRELIKQHQGPVKNCIFTYLLFLEIFLFVVTCQGFWSQNRIF